MGGSKPATLRQGVHISSFICCKGKRKVFGLWSKLDRPSLLRCLNQSYCPFPIYPDRPTGGAQRSGANAGAKRLDTRPPQRCRPWTYHDQIVSFLKALFVSSSCGREHLCQVAQSSEASSVFFSGGFSSLV